MVPAPQLLLLSWMTRKIPKTFSIHHTGRLKRMNQKKNLGTAFENRVVKTAEMAGLSAERQPLSGVLKQFPNDVTLGGGRWKVLAECKVRTAELSFDGQKHFPFNLDWLKGVMGNAQRMGYRMGAVVFASKHSQDKYVVLTLDDFLSLLISRQHEDLTTD
jgi:hypothetical protein